MLEQSWAVFWQLVEAPFSSPRCVWGIVPLYFGWFLNELSPGKASFRTAIQTGFTLMWASAQWLYHDGTSGLELSALRAVNGTVSVLVMTLGLLALVSGLRRKFPRYGSFLGHTRFSGYFMIMMFPVQAGLFPWSWPRLAAIFVFALPVWALVYLAFTPLRK